VTGGPPTPSQTVGPYLSIGLDWPDGPDLAPAGTAGEIRIRGRLLDGAGEAVPDGMVEVWQADRQGRYPHPDDPRAGAPDPGFRGFGRCLTGPDGTFWFRTVKPGRVPDRDGAEQAPHLAVSVFGRGVLTRLATRLYFADEPAANAADALLRALPEDARATLLAAPEPGGYAWTIRLQGPGETVFLDV
jgi:protocatechuate 3,4-dioxygenase alpha subunit